METDTIVNVMRLRNDGRTSTVSVKLIGLPDIDFRIQAFSKEQLIVSNGTHLIFIKIET